MIAEGTAESYTSALNSYLEFIRLHSFPIEPTQEILSFYVVFMCAAIKPDSVDSYLSGICNSLELYFPEVRANRRSPLVSKTLAGCKRIYSSPKRQKRPLSIEDLEKVISHYDGSIDHDDLLFVSMLLTGFYALLRLGELVYPNKKSLRNPRKRILRSSVLVNESFPSYSFHLPGHKGDQTFEGHLIIVPDNDRTTPLQVFKSYLASRDHLFPISIPLWLRANGSTPTRSWFIKRLRSFFSVDIAGQSMRAGGATTLACAGVSHDLIQAIGRWTSSTFQIYIRKNPVLVAATLHSKRSNR